MRHRTLATVLVMICGSNAAFPQSKQIVPRGSGGRNVALVIGNSSYEERPLKNVSNDANDIRKALRDKGFAVSTCCDNVRLEAMQMAIDDWTASLQKDDIAVFYFSGHGIRVNSADYLVPIGYPSSSTQADVRFRAYALDELQEKMQERATKVNLIIVDACRDNPYVLGKGLEEGLAGATAGFGTYIIYAASPGHVASVNAEGNNSLFTLALLKELERPSVSLRTLGPNVKDKVYLMSNGIQIPYISENIIGDVVLGAASAAVTEPTRDALTMSSSLAPFELTPSQPNKEIKDPAEYYAYVGAVKKTDQAAEISSLEAFLAQYPSSIMREDALEVLMAAYEQAGNQAKAIDAANRLLTSNHNNFRALVLLAYEERAAQKWADANDHAVRGLEVLPNIAKPHGLLDSEFALRITVVSTLLNSVAGFSALQLKDNATAVKYLRAAVEGDPNDVGNVYPLAVAYLTRTPEDDVNGLFFIGRAVNLLKDPTSKAKVTAYGHSKYVRYHGSEEGWDELLARTATTPLPPPGFTI